MEEEGVRQDLWGVQGIRTGQGGGEEIETRKR